MLSVVFKIFRLNILVLTFVLSNSLIYAQNPSNSQVAIELTNMNVFYVGMDNNIKIVVSDIESSKIEISIDNGSVSGQNGEYIVHPKISGTATITIKHDNKIIQKSTYRVKNGLYTYPVLFTENKTFTSKESKFISKKDLNNVLGLKVEAQNSDYDINFKIIEFSISAKINDQLIDLMSHNDKFTEEQKKVFAAITKGSKIIIENVKVKVPDGTFHIMPTMVITVIED